MDDIQQSIIDYLEQEIQEEAGILLNAIVSKGKCSKPTFYKRGLNPLLEEGIIDKIQEGNKRIYYLVKNRDRLKIERRDLSILERSLLKKSEETVNELLELICNGNRDSFWHETPQKHKCHNLLPLVSIVERTSGVSFGEHPEYNSQLDVWLEYYAKIVNALDPASKKLW